MNDFGDTLDAKLSSADELLRSGRKKEARKVLREALAMDRDNLATWELLLRAAYDVREEQHCLNRILAIDPNHAAARSRLAALRPASGRTPNRPTSRRKRQEGFLLLFLLGSLVSLVCVSAAAFALFRGGYFPFLFSTDLTATAIAQRNASCQALIDRAIQASDSFCGETGTNKACYGNTTLQAELVPGTTDSFSERGDIIAVNALSRLTASPLDIEGMQWGIAVFKLITNLPRSLPGETVTMVVFGNATLDNVSEDSESLESFYFSSELGQIVCEKVPFDGLMITSPDGNGIQFKINGAELTLVGSASVKAIRNGQMEVSVYRGSARIMSNGEEQYLGAGSKSSVQLGGEDGTEAISGPSDPESLSQEELDMACTMTGEFCSEDEIIPVSGEEAQNQIQASMLTVTPSVTPIPTATLIPTNTLLVLPSSTTSPGPTAVFTRTNTPAPTRTPVPPTRTRTSTPTRTFTPTNTFTPTLTFTNTPSPTVTPEGPNEPICANVSLANVTLSGNDLSMDITNNNGGDIFISRLFAIWEPSSPQQKLDQLLLGGVSVWNTSDNFPPSDFPAEGPGGSWPSLDADRTILNGGTGNFLLRFQENLQLPYKVHIVFNIGCQVITP
jgi:hypothetical protein